MAWINPYQFNSPKMPFYVIPPVECIEVEFPINAEEVLMPQFEGMYPGFSWWDGSGPFCPADGTLLCLKEKDFFHEREKFFVYGDRRCPSNLGRNQNVGASLYQTVLEVDESDPNDILRFVNSFGMLFLPCLHSQTRFIDSRFHEREKAEGAYTYSKAHPPGHLKYMVPRKRRFGRKGREENLQEFLADAIWDVYSERMRESMVLLHLEPFSDVSLKAGRDSHDILHALIYSEYARRLCCETAHTTNGGIISLYEVSLAISLLKTAIEGMIDIEIARGSNAAYIERLERHVATSRYDKLALEMALRDDGRGKQEANWGFSNLSRKNAEDYLEFLSACILETRGVNFVSFDRNWENPHPSPHSGNGFPVYDLNTISSFYSKVEPRWLDNKYVEGSLSAAIAEEFLETLGQPGPWKTCIQCGKAFKFKGGALRKERQPRNDAKVCSGKCERARNQYNNVKRKVLGNAFKRLSNDLRQGKPSCEALSNALDYTEKNLEGELKGRDPEACRKNWEDILRKKAAEKGFALI